MGTETNFRLVEDIRLVRVKLNNPQMGTETIYRFSSYLRLQYHS